jgi:predicted tellurium resistance membrane protein TerC
MALLLDPQTWLSFLMLTVLEIVLGIDNIIFLAILVDRLPAAQRNRGRILGLGFAMLTRIALLFSIVWLTMLRNPLFTLFGKAVSGRALILFAGGLFLLISSVVEIGDMFKGEEQSRKPGSKSSLWLIILQIGILDIVFSLDSVFTAIGLAQHVRIMVAAIVVSVLIMMWVSAAVSAFIERYPTIKVLALAFLMQVGVALIVEATGRSIPKGYLYFAMAFAAAVEWINIRVRRRNKP